MPLPGFEPGSPRPQSKYDDLDRSAIGPAFNKGERDGAQNEYLFIF